MAEEERRRRTPTLSRPLPKRNRRRMEQLLSSTKTALFSGSTDKGGEEIDRFIASYIQSLLFICGKEQNECILALELDACGQLSCPSELGGEGARLLLTQNCTAMPPPPPPPAAMDVWRCGQEEKGGRGDSPLTIDSQGPPSASSD